LSHEVVAALVVESEKILLGLRSANRTYYPGVWDMFGGHVEPGESHEQTLVRELQEELGITPTGWTYLETLTLVAPLPAPDDQPSETWTVHLYRVNAWKGIPFNRQPQEHSVMHWFSLPEAMELQLAHPIYPTLFAKYLHLTNR
jgi:8-oxo-dGTP diphosphatase